MYPLPWSFHFHLVEERKIKILLAVASKPIKIKINKKPYAPPLVAISTPSCHAHWGGVPLMPVGYLNASPSLPRRGDSAVCTSKLSVAMVSVMQAVPGCQQLMCGYGPDVYFAALQ